MLEVERLTSHQFENLRRSWAGTHQLMPSQAEQVMFELEQLLAERRQLRELLDEMGQGPWREVRAAMGRLRGLVGEG